MKIMIIVTLAYRSNKIKHSDNFDEVIMCHQISNHSKKDKTQCRVCRVSE